jgi:predicted Zn-dependent protease
MAQWMEHASETVALLQECSPVAREMPIELFRRSSLRTRAEWSAARSAIDFHTGSEHGMAVRVLDSGAASVAFAAASGRSPSVARDTVAQALATETTGAGELPLWAEPDEAPTLDDRATGDPPDLDELAAWLAAGVAGWGGSGAAAGVDTFWVEHAVTVESLAATNGLRRCRRRSRVWTTCIAGRIRRTRAATSLAALDPWVGVSPPCAPGGRFEPSPTQSLTVRLEPDPAAGLVALLAPGLHGSGAAGTLPVGPGWNVADHPNQPGGLGGGLFDDAGFPTRDQVLAQSGLTLDPIGRKGHLFRDSYRDPPRPAFTNLMVSPGGDGSGPAADLIVSWSRIHPLSTTRWLMEARGALASTGGALEVLLDLGDPATLPKRCSAAVGAAWGAAPRTMAPALVFEGLRAAQIPGWR